FSPDALTLATCSSEAGWPQMVRLWDAKTGQHRATLPGGPRSSLMALTFSPDGRRVFAWESGEKVLVWTVADGQPADAADPLPLPHERASSRLGLVVSPDGSLRADVRSYGVVLTNLALERQESEERLALEPINRLFWHQQQAAQAEKDNEWFAA